MLTVDEILAASDNGTLKELAEAEAARIQREIMELYAHRQAIIDNCVSALREGVGLDAKVACAWKSKPPLQGIVTETFYFAEGQTYRHAFEYFAPHARSRSTGIRLIDGALTIYHGTHQLVAADGRKTIVVPLQGADGFEDGHRSTIRSLRTIARREGMRISVRDRDIALLDPMGTILHSGTAITTLAFIAGIDLAHPAEEIRP